MFQTDLKHGETELRHRACTRDQNEFAPIEMYPATGRLSLQPKEVQPASQEPFQVLLMRFDPCAKGILKITAFDPTKVAQIEQNGFKMAAQLRFWSFHYHPVFLLFQFSGGQVLNGGWVLSGETEPGGPPCTGEVRLPLLPAAVVPRRPLLRRALSERWFCK